MPLMHSEVEFCSIIRTRILSLDGMLGDGGHCYPETNSLLRRLADPFRKKRGDADRFEKDEDGSNDNADERGDESMDVD